MRTKLAPFERSCGPIAVLGAGLLLSACSADVTRFDFPAFGLGNSGATGTSALPAPPDPIYQYEAPKSVARLPKYGTQKPYKVAQADTISRSNLGRPDDDLEPLPRVTTRPAPVPSYAAPKKRDYSAHQGATVVQRGDTLYGISRRTGASVSAIRRANNLVGSNIRIGQRLIIPGARTVSETQEQAYRPAPKRRETNKSWTYDEPRTTASTSRKTPSLRVTKAKRPTFDDNVQTSGTYRVQAGDSLYGIARKTGVAADRISEANDIYDPSRIRVGQVLKIPGSSSRLQTVKVERAPKRKWTEPRKVVSLDKDDFGYSSDAAESRPATSGKFRWPVQGRIISRFGGKTASGNNDGVNFAVPEGTSVKSVEDGVVAYAGSELKGYGRLVLVRHKDDWVSAYGHNSKLLVKRGDRVRRGQIIAKAGRTGSVKRPQVHFELRKGSKPVDPLKHLASN